MQMDFELRPNEGLPVSAHHRMRAAGAVVWSESMKGWVVSSYEAVRNVLSDLEGFTSVGTPVANAFGAEAMLVNDTPLHNTIRAVWLKHVSRTAMGLRKDELEGYAARVLEGARPDLEAGKSVDFISLFRQFATLFIASSFGVPDNRLDVFKLWSAASLDAPVLEMEGGETQNRYLIAKNAVLDMIREQVKVRKERFARGVQPTDLTDLMVAAEGKLSPTIVVDNLFNFTLGAFDTTERWLGNIIIKLANAPDVRARVAADRKLVEPFVEEVMRHTSVVQVIERKVKKDGVVLEGAKLKAGDTMYLMFGAANRDPAEFEDPDTFNIDRPLKTNLGFGFGYHHCLGIHIARQEAIAFTNVYLDKFPAARVADADFGKTWALWGPGSLHIKL
jgi:cytochrome P450